MNKSDVRYAQFVSILKEKLLPAMGCSGGRSCCNR